MMTSRIIIIGISVIVLMGIVSYLKSIQRAEQLESQSAFLLGNSQTAGREELVDNRELVDEAHAVLSGLTLEEKIGQLFIIGFDGKTIEPETERFIREFKPGGVLLLSKNIDTKEQLKSLTTVLQDISLKNTGLPLFVAVDQEGEPVCRIRFAKNKTPQSEIEDAGEARKLGLERGRELKALGVNLNLAPLLDITQRGDFLFERSFQKEREKTGELVKALISGQKEAGILSAVKHFPGYGGISFNPEEELANVEALPDISSFQQAMEAGPSLVMAANVIYQESDPLLPFTFSSSGIRFLRETLNFQGIVISDDLAQNSLLREFSLEELIILPIKAGVDILIFSGFRLPPTLTLREIITQAVKEGRITEQRIDHSVLKIIQLKQDLL